jgi:hypothetical protein
MSKMWSEISVSFTTDIHNFKQILMTFLCYGYFVWGGNLNFCWCKIILMSLWKHYLEIHEMHMSLISFSQVMFFLPCVSQCDNIYKTVLQQLSESLHMQCTVFKWLSLALNSTSEILGLSDSDTHSSPWHLAHLDSCYKTNEQFFLLFLGSHKQTQRTALWDSDNANEAPSSASEV